VPAATRRPHEIARLELPAAVPASGHAQRFHEEAPSVLASETCYARKAATVQNDLMMFVQRIRIGGAVLASHDRSPDPDP